eukprot:GHVH01017360.1.p1 GENE.GHVH01017360.1~~GHVH01017360.1.p1  ORF type:complete len:340 (+),score=43.66 GHVH01017360.1:783-1802(+)
MSVFLNRKDRTSFAEQLFHLFTECIFVPEFRKKQKLNEEVESLSSFSLSSLCAEGDNPRGYECWSVGSTDVRTLPIVWKSRLTGAAGKFRSTKRFLTTKILKKYLPALSNDEDDDTSQDIYTRGWIELSSKILDTPGRIAGTLLHEMCHAAQKLIDEDVFGEVAEKPHGPRFKRWTNLCAQQFPEFREGLRTYHDYSSFRPFRWRCNKCNSVTARHSKSLNYKRTFCAKKDESGVAHSKLGLICYGAFEYLGKFDRSDRCTTPGKRGLKVDEIVANTTVSTISPYRQFQKKTIEELKELNPDIGFKEMVQGVNQRWKAHKDEQELKMIGSTMQSEPCDY